MRLISSGSGKSRRKPPQTTSCLTAADRRRVFPHRIITNWKKACPRYNPATQPPVTPLVLDSKWCVEALASARTQSSRSKFGPKRVNSKKVATRTQRKSPTWRKKIRMLLLGYYYFDECNEDLANFLSFSVKFENCAENAASYILL